LYYGTEQAFNGGKDPWDREDMFAGKFEWGPSRGDNFNMTHPLFQLVAKLNNLRRLYPELQTGTQSNVWSNANGPGLFAYARQLGTREIFVVLNTANTNEVLPPCPGIFPAGTKLLNALDEKETVTVNADGQIPSLAMTGTSAKIFVAKSEFRPLDPTVTEISPRHDAQGIAATGAIVVHFSQPMDSRSVERAFSTVPPVKGAFSWSATRDEMTFTPDSAGFPAQSMVNVRIGDTARDAVFGRTFYAGFESHYRCGTPDSLTQQ
jgi:hypothetical protein